MSDIENKIPCKLDAATLEWCARIAETTKSGPIYYGKDGAPNAAVVIRGDIIASAIRSLIPNSAGADLGPHRATAGESDLAVTQDCAPGTVSALNSQYAGLEALLAAIHADDPKRELLVRVGDLMRENRALLSQFDVRRRK